MALRINNKERQLIRQLNIRAQRKSNRLFKTYGLKKMTFKTTRVKDFKTRQELNQYKKDIQWYLRPATHRYVRGGLVSARGNQYYYAIPREDAWQIQRLIRQRNRSIRRFREEYGGTRLDIKGRPQTATLDFLLTQRTSYKSNKLNQKYSVYKPLKFHPELISTKKSLNRLKYGLKNFQSKQGIKAKQKRAQDNYIDALYNTFGSNAYPLVKALEQLSVDEFIAFYESDTFADFYYVYDIAQMNNLLQSMATHFMNFIKQRNIQIDDQLIEILTATLDLDSAQILAKYGQGAYGGQRVILPSRGVTTYYIDLLPEEAEEYYLYGQDINALYNIVGGEEELKKRRKVLSVRKFGKNGQ